MSDTRSRVRGAIEAILVDEHGPGALTRRPIRSGSTMNLTDPTDYRQGIDAAQRVIGTAEAIIRDYAKRARGNGRSWADIAQALDRWADYKRRKKAKE